jgi:type I restriction enzyme S subunit
VKLSDTLKANRIDPHYHQPRYACLHAVLDASPFKPRRLDSLVSELDYGLMPTEDYAESEAEGVAMIRVTNILPDGTIDMSDVKYIRHGTPRLDEKRVRAGDVLMVQCGSTTGKVAIVPEECASLTFGSFCFVIRATDTDLQRYLFYALDSRFVQEQIQRTWNVVTVRPNTSKPDVSALSIPLPPADVQRQLVREMDEARLARQRKLVEAEGLLAGLDEYLLAQLGLTPPPPDSRKMFAVRLTTLQKTDRLNADYFHPERILAIRAMEANRAKMRVERLADIGDFIRDAVPADSSDNYLGLANVQSNTGELVESGEKPAEGLCFKFRTGDVLFARLRPYLNKVHRAERGGICSTEFHVIRTRPPTKPEAEIRPDYLATVLRSSLVLAQTRHMMTGNTHPRLANEDVVNLVVPIPKAAIQERIAGEVARRRTEARRLRTEAAAGWAAAKARFEQQLLGSSQP